MLITVTNNNAILFHVVIIIVVVITTSSTDKKISKFLQITCSMSMTCLAKYGHLLISVITPQNQWTEHKILLGIRKLNTTKYS